MSAGIARWPLGGGWSQPTWNASYRRSHMWRVRTGEQTREAQTARPQGDAHPPCFFLSTFPPNHPCHLPFCTVQCPASALRAERTHSGSLPRTDGYYVQFVTKGCYPAFWWKQRTLHCWRQQCPTEPNVSALCTSWLPQQHPASFFELFISLCKTTGLHIPVLCWTHWWLWASHSLSLWALCFSLGERNNRKGSNILWYLWFQIKGWS